MEFCLVLTLAFTTMKGLDAFVPMGHVGNQEAKLDRMLRTFMDNEEKNSGMADVKSMHKGPMSSEGSEDVWEAIRELQSEMEMHAEEIMVMKQDIDEFDTGLKQVETKIENHDTEIGALKKKDDELADDISGLQTDITGMRQDISDHNLAVSFTASTRSHLTYSSGQRVVFSQALSNVGNHYNTNTGEFTCPHNGLYMFNIDILRGGNNGRSVVRIKRGTTYLTSVFVHVKDGTDRHASAMAVVPCDKGVKVYMEADSDNCHIYGYYSFYHSIFSGVLIRRMD